MEVDDVQVQGTQVRIRRWGGKEGKPLFYWHEAADRVLELHVLAGRACEGLGDEERLREEALHLARALDDELVLVGELVHTEDGDDVLQLAVALEELLHARRGPVVLLADDVGLERA